MVHVDDNYQDLGNHSVLAHIVLFLVYRCEICHMSFRFIIGLNNLMQHCHCFVFNQNSSSN